MRHHLLDRLPVWLSPGFEPLIPALEEAWRADSALFCRPSPEFEPDARSEPGQAAQQAALRCEEFPSFLPLFWAALADWASGQAQETGFVSIAGQTALKIAPGEALAPDPEWASHGLTEPLMGLSSVPVARGVSVAGAASPMDWPGVADAVAVYSGTALEAAQVAFEAALMVQGPYAKSDYGPAAGPFADAMGEVPVVSKLGHLDPEETWDTLAPGARVLSEARQKGTIKAAAIALRGRGRVIGSLDPNPLMRFRASQWR